MVAAMLGKPLMEWQQYVADVILEIDPDTGRLAYDEYDLTVPRQSGKSTFVLAKSTHRASATGFFGKRQHLVYTAQTRQKAREKWEEDFVLDLESSRKFRSKVTVHKGNGNEHIRFANGSRFGIEANTEKAGHGGTLDEAYIDEAFAQVDNRLEQAFRPAMITRFNKQLGIISTAGWLDASPYLWAKVQLGRQLVIADVRRGTAYFEWSAPDDADPGDLNTWLQCMPALHRPDCQPDCRRHTVTIEAIRSEYDTAVREGKLADFRRAYLNQWLLKPVELEHAVINGDLWKANRDAESQLTGKPTFALDVAPDRSSAAIGVAGSRSDDLTHIEITSRDGVMDHRPGTAWIVPRLLELKQTFPSIRLLIAAGSAAESLVTDIESAGISVEQVPEGDVPTACGFFYDRAVAGRLRHLSQPELDKALAAARKREVGDKAWAWGRRKSTEDITPVYAVTLAVWGAVGMPAPEVSVFFFSDLDACDKCGEPAGDNAADRNYLCEKCWEERE
jgi:phage terminase large subunit-like protein